jgi:hypothetical protein
MADPFDPIPDDETVDALQADAEASLAASVPGWEHSDGAIEVAILAAAADEGSTLYALLREEATDRFADFGRNFLGIPQLEPTRATTTTTWRLTAVAPAGGYLIPAGTQIVVQAASGLVGFETPLDTTIPEGEDTWIGLLVQALEPGSAATGATGTVIFDQQPVDVLSVTVDAPATGGSDGETDDAYLDGLRREIRLLARAPITTADTEDVALEIPGIARALVRDLYDDTTGLDNQPRTVSVYPVDAAGATVSSGIKTALAALLESRREVNFVFRVADPTYTTVNVEIKVAAVEGQDHTDLATRVAAAVASDAINPAVFGQTAIGDRPTWKRRTNVRRGDVATVASNVMGVAYVFVDSTLKLNTTAADLALTGAAPLPTPGTVTVTVVDPV